MTYLKGAIKITFNNDNIYNENWETREKKISQLAWSVKLRFYDFGDACTSGEGFFICGEYRKPGDRVVYIKNHNKPQHWEPNDEIENDEILTIIGLPEGNDGTSHSLVCRRENGERVTVHLPACLMEENNWRHIMSHDCPNLYKIFCTPASEQDKKYGSEIQKWFWMPVIGSVIATLIFSQMHFIMIAFVLLVMLIVINW